jgi:hypothetical protein
MAEGVDDPWAWTVRFGTEKQQVSRPNPVEWRALFLRREFLAQRRKENPLETRQRFAPLRLCVTNLLGNNIFGKPDRT